MDIKAYQSELRDLAKRNGWSEYLTKGAIASALIIEAAELLDLFKWGEMPTQERLADEIADVQIFLLQLADRCGVDIERAVCEKMAANWQREPDGPRFKE